MEVSLEMKGESIPDIKQLKKQYEIVKSHPYRLNHEIRFVKSFYKEVDKLSDFFYELTKEGYLIHEVNSNIWHLVEGYYNENSCEKISKGEIIKMIELFITTVHRYIVSGKLEEFWTHYLGCNYDKKKGRWSHYVKENGKWVEVSK